MYWFTIGQVRSVLGEISGPRWDISPRWDIRT